MKMVLRTSCWIGDMHMGGEVGRESAGRVVVWARSTRLPRLCLKGGLIMLQVVSNDTWFD